MTGTSISTVPEHFTSVTPWIISPSTEKQMAFLTRVFGAVEIPGTRFTREDGIIIHAVMQFGTAMIMLFDSREGWPASPAYLNIYVEDLESVWQQALELGAKPVSEPTQLWFGEKTARILDPSGNLLWIVQRTEELDYSQPEVLSKRSSSPEALAGIAYIQESLDAGMRMQREFFKASGK